MKAMMLVFLALIIIGCQKSNNDLHEQAAIEKEKLADHVLRQVATKLKQETNLHPCGTMGQMLNEIQKLGLTFFYYRPIDIIEGREMLVSSVDKMLKEINNEPRIQPYLIQYPFKPRNIQIEIFLRNPDGSDIPQNHLWVIEASEGMLRYLIHHPKRSGYITIYKETYEEAVERIANPALPLVPFQPDPDISQETLARLHKSISFIGDDGTIKQINENGHWIK